MILSYFLDPILTIVAYFDNEAVSFKLFSSFFVTNTSFSAGNSVSYILSLSFISVISINLFYSFNYTSSDGDSGNIYPPKSFSSIYTDLFLVPCIPVSPLRLADELMVTSPFLIFISGGDLPIDLGGLSVSILVWIYDPLFTFLNLS